MNLTPGSRRWDDVRLEIGVVVIRADETKFGRPHHIPLTPWSRAILEALRRDNALWRPDEESPWVFPSVKHGKHIDGANGVIDELGEGTSERITAHDLRRTLATDMMEFATEADRLGKILAVGAMLNHAGADQAAST